VSPEIESRKALFFMLERAGETHGQTRGMPKRFSDVDIEKIDLSFEKRKMERSY
jgi:hypothetical protein